MSIRCDTKEDSFELYVKALLAMLPLTIDVSQVLLEAEDRYLAAVLAIAVSPSAQSARIAHLEAVRIEYVETLQQLADWEGTPT